MEDIFTLLEKLSKYPKEIIEIALTKLMLENKIDFVNLSNSYVKCLKMTNEDQLNKLIEAESCVLEQFSYKTTKKFEDEHNGDYKHTQRSLYLLNKSNRYAMSSLNEKYHYDEEFAKKMSWYERNKGMDNF